MSYVRAYSAPIAVTQTSAATASGSLVWAITNNNTANTAKSKQAYITRIMVNVLVAGTTPAATIAIYNLVRFRGPSPPTPVAPTGGTAITIIPKNRNDKYTPTLLVPSVFGDARFLDTGLTLGTVVLDTALASMGAPRTAGGVQYIFEWADPGTNGFELGMNEPVNIEPGDGFGIVLGATSAVGDGIYGIVEWNEMGGSP